MAIGTAVKPFQGTLVAVAALLATIALIAGFMPMTSLFNRYRRGEIFSDSAAKDIPRKDLAMMFVAATTALVSMLQVLILRRNAAQRTLQTGLDGASLRFLLCVGLMFKSGW